MPTAVQDQRNLGQDEGDGHDWRIAVDGQSEGPEDHGRTRDLANSQVARSRREARDGPAGEVLGLSSLVVVSGPSGAGKGTVIKAACQQITNVRLAVSWTTRPRRSGEVDGIHYKFVSDVAFDAARESNAFAEFVSARGAHYGTPWSEISDAATSTGRNEVVVLEIDVDGARSVKALFNKAVTVFIKPPSTDELRKRLMSRGTDSSDEISRRLKLAERELTALDEFDHVIENVEVSKAALELGRILVGCGAISRQ